MIIRIILGIIMLTVIFGPLIYLFHLKNKGIRNLQKLADTNPELKEKVRIIRSRNVSTSIKDKKKVIKNFSSIILFMALLIISIILLYKFKIDSRTILFLLLAVLIIFIIYLKLRDKKNDYDIVKYIETLLIKKYNMIKREPVHSKEVVYGDKSQEGNIRNTYVFSYKILKFKCLLNNYYQEKLIREVPINDSTSYSYRYQKIRNVFEYYYNLNAIGIKNINKDIILSDNIRQSIQELTKTKIINVDIKNEYLLVQKEVVLFDYSENDADIDTNDVELFYNKIVKLILEENNNV